MRRLVVLVSVVIGLAAGRGEAACSGDCSGDHAVTVSEMVTGVNLALGNAGSCPAFDANGDGQVVVNELVAAVANLLGGCPFIGEYSARIDVGDGETGLLRISAAADGTATGTLSVGDSAASAGRGGLRIEIPLLHLTGTIDLDSGAFHLTGTADGEDGPVPVDVSGTLPDNPRGSGAVDLDIDGESFAGTVLVGNGQPTPTRTATNTPPAASPTPTPTAIPANFPTPGASCEGGAMSLHFSQLNGVNSFADLGADLNLGKGAFNIINGVGAGGGFIPCTLKVGDVLRRVQLIYISGAVATGSVLTLGRARGLVTFDYLEAPATNPLATRGWRSDSGTIVFDSVDGNDVRFHIIGAVMSPEPSFSFQQPATGTFVIDAGARKTP